MKRKERHHLKENELAHSIETARDFLETRQRQITGIAIGLVVVVLGVVAYTVYRQQTQSRGSELLAEAMVALNVRVVPAGAPGQGEVPAAAALGATGTYSTEEAKLTAALPKLKAAADAYPDSTAGITARYHMAGALAALGRNPDAIQAFDEVTKRAGASSLYGRMARLGKAESQAHAGQLDAAIAAWKDLAATSGDDLPVDAILMVLARAYVQKGNTEEARKAFTEVVDKHPNSPYSAEARAELEGLKG
ncbi:MAG TPA: tetratricopeptide repeat protein [Vicinamibacterales bacterium]|nr:tetratricopeptide repeat protein [Vicinamibacterales bacterium]